MNKSNAETINAMMNMATVQNLSTQNAVSEQNSGGGQDFSNMLNSMLGGGTVSWQAGTKTNADIGTGPLLGGIRMLDTQNASMLRGLESTGKTDTPAVTDPLLAQLLEMLKGKSGGEGDTLQALLEQMQKRLKAMLEEDGATTAGSQAMAFLNQLLPLLAPPNQTQEMAQALAAGGNNSALDLMLQQSPGQLAALLQGDAVPADAAGQAVVVADVLPQQTAGPGKAQTAFAQAVQSFTEPAQQPSQTEQTTGLPGLTEATVKTETGKPGLSDLLETGKAQSDFASAVRTVKDQMASGQAAGVPKKEPGHDELQQQVNLTGAPERVLAAEIQQPTQQPASAPQPVPMQLQDAVTTALQNGTQELTVKLNPEALGEVTIKLQKAHDGSMALNIIAKNPETQRILAAELSQLQQNLRPLNVDVESITTESQYQMASGQQQFGGEHQRSWRQMHGASYYGDDDLGSQSQAQAAAPVSPSPTSALDAYI